MNYNSPKYSNKVNPPYRNSDEFRSPFASPQNNSPGFSPYSSSSPKKHHKGPMRYFNSSTTSTNSSCSNGSPYKQYNRNNRENYNRNSRGSTDSSNLSLYYDPSALENPWAELEKEYEEKKGKDSPKILKE
uniref:Unkown protein n=1 Tax=Riptortus pedestris TaxID=329032 RepID=R4WR09_RIPPE|nr:unkown protein [Riptortus pedestris]